MATQQLFSPANAFIQGRAAAQQYRAGEQRNALAQMELDNAPVQMERRNRLADLQVEGAQMGIDAERAKVGYARLKQALDSGNPKAYVLQREPELVAKLQQQGVDLASVDDQTAARIIDGFAREYAGKAGILPANEMQSGVQSTFVGKNGNMWLVGRDGHVRDTGTAVSQFAQKPVEAGGGLYSYDPGRGALTGQIASPKVQIGAAAAKAGAQQEAKESATTAAIPQQVGAKTQAERSAVFIDEGLRAADSLPVINRALELLDSVKTGGIDAAKLAATNFFGITGADEAELSNNLGKAVLSQLRATFGAQFTEREGARLDQIEANFGKSTAGNRRLLQQTKQIVERAARRGINAAEETGDMFSADEIRRSMSMDLRPASPAQATTPQAGQEVTATGPNGEKLVLRNGQWVPM